MTDHQNFNVYTDVFRVALFNGVWTNIIVCSDPPEIDWYTGSTYNSEINRDISRIPVTTPRFYGSSISMGLLPILPEAGT